MEKGKLAVNPRAPVSDKVLESLVNEMLYGHNQAKMQQDLMLSSLVHQSNKDENNTKNI